MVCCCVMLTEGVNTLWKRTSLAWEYGTKSELGQDVHVSQEGEDGEDGCDGGLLLGSSQGVTELQRPRCQYTAAVHGGREKIRARAQAVDVDVDVQVQGRSCDQRVPDLTWPNLVAQRDRRKHGLNKQ